MNSGVFCFHFLFIFACFFLCPLIPKLIICIFDVFFFTGPRAQVSDKGCIEIEKSTQFIFCNISVFCRCLIISIYFQVNLSAGSTFDEFKVSISEDIGFPLIPDVRLKVCRSLS